MCLTSFNQVKKIIQKIGWLVSFCCLANYIHIYNVFTVWMERCSFVFFVVAESTLKFREMQLHDGKDSGMGTPSPEKMALHIGN